MAVGRENRDLFRLNKGRSVYFLSESDRKLPQYNLLESERKAPNYQSESERKAPHYESTSQREKHPIISPSQREKHPIINPSQMPGTTCFLDHTSSRGVIRKLTRNEHFIFPDCNRDLQKEFFMFYMQKCLQQSIMEPPPYSANGM